MKSFKRWMESGARVALLGAVASFGLAGCGEKGQASSSAAGRGPGGRGGGARVAVVETASVELGSIARRVTVSGVVEPIRTVGINSQLAGGILAVEALEGDVVRSGTVLARLDDRELKAQLASAEAGYEVARANFQRAERLREGQVITAAEYDRDRAALLASEAQLQQLRTRHDYTTVRAPINGVVTEKRVEAGDVVGVQTRLFTLADVDTMVVRVQVSELDVVDLVRGAAVTVVLDAYPDQQLTGRIRRVFPAADPATRLVPVEVALRQPGERIARSGFLARVEFALGARNGVLLVPASAVVGDAGASAVFVVQDGAVARRTVQTGLTSEGRIEIVAGIRAGETVVTVGNNSLRDGAQVRIVSQGGVEREKAAADHGEGEQGRAR